MFWLSQFGGIWTRFVEGSFQIPLIICRDPQGMPYRDTPIPPEYIQLWLQDGHDHQMDRQKGASCCFLFLLMLLLFFPQVGAFSAFKQFIAYLRIQRHVLPKDRVYADQVL